MRFNLSIAVDNCVPIGGGQPFLGEHGLSMLLETDGVRLLLDTGQSGTAVVNNLSLLGVPPATLSGIVLSHGHYDHCGGLAQVLAHAGKRLPVHVHGEAFAARYSESGGTRKFVGIPHRREYLESLGADWRTASVPEEIRPGVWVSGSVPRRTDFETGDARLVTVPEGEDCACQDALADDMALYLRTEAGLVVLAGCAHAGMLNMIAHGLAVTGCTRLAGWVGGTHLGPVSGEQQAASIEALLALQPDFVAASHCTGFAMLARLQAAFGERFKPACVGARFSF